MTGKRSRRARLRFPCIPGERIVMRMMVKALLFDSAGEIEKLQALQIDWAGCGVSELCATSDFAEAYRLTMENKVHIIFCNYEMENSQGLRLIKLMEEKSDVFLVNLIHQDSTVQLKKPRIKFGSNWTYLFLPTTKQTAEKRLKKITAELPRQADEKTMAECGRTFLRYLDIYQELFWKDLFNGLIPVTRNNIMEFARQRRVELEWSGYYLLRMKCLSDAGLLSKWTKREKIGALRNMYVSVFDEYLLSTVFYDEYRVTAVLHAQDGEKKDIEEIFARSEELVRILEREFGIQCLICVYRSCISIDQLCTCGMQLEEITERYIGGRTLAIYSDDTTLGTQLPISQARFFKWTILAESNAFQALREDVDEFFIRLKNKILTKDAAYAILFRFWGIISQAAKSQLLDMQDFGLEEAVRIVTSTPLMTIEDLHQLCNRLLQKVQALNEGGLETKQLVEAIKSYISENIYYDLSRETIAEQLKYHPDHLSRVFKKATGETLINYIQNEKIKTAIYLLRKPTFPSARWPTAWAIRTSPISPSFSNRRRATPCANTSGST